MFRKTGLVLGLTIITVGCGVARQAAAPSPATEARQVRAIYLGDFGRTADATETKLLMRSVLESEGQFTVVAEEREADAVLSGVVVLRRSSGRLQDARVLGELRLRVARSGDLLWQHRYVERSLQVPFDQPTPRELYERFARQMSEELHRTIGSITASR
jgi:hypothetical protein